MTAALVCQGVSKRFGDVTALDGVDMTVEPGEVRGLIGHNGAGKSTLLRCVLGLVRPDSGSIQLLGRDGPPAPGAALDGVAGLVDGARWPATMRVEQVLRMAAQYDAKTPDDITKAVESLSLQPLLRRRVRGLSLGGRQRLGLAAALLRAPQLLLLDEPINGLDPDGRHDLRHVIRSVATGGTAVVIASHDLTELAATCDTVTQLREGSVTTEQARRRVRVRTADDTAARKVLADLVLSDDDDGLRIEGTVSAIDEASLRLGRAGIPIRSWEPAP